MSATQTFPAELPTSLDPVEISLPQQHRLAEVTFRHSGWAYARRRVLHALLAAGVPDARVDRFANCGAYAWVLRSRRDPETLRVAASFCHDRLCRPCQRARANVIAHNLLRHQTTARLRFITLTIRHNLLPLALQLQKLTHSFRRLRRSQCWRKATRGGVAFIEIKRNSADTHWHPHLHVIHEGSYIPHRDLRDTWHRLTRDSYVVHLRTVTNPTTVARYVTTYANKPFDPSLTNNPDHLLAVVHALRNRRTIFTFGSWRTVSLRATTRDYDDWEPVQPLYEVLRDADHGEPEALRIIALLRRATPCMPQTPTPTDRSPPNQPYSDS